MEGEHTIFGHPFAGRFFYHKGNKEEAATATVGPDTRPPVTPAQRPYEVGKSFPRKPLKEQIEAQYNGEAQSLAAVAALEVRECLIELFVKKGIGPDDLNHQGAEYRRDIQDRLRRKIAEQAQQFKDQSEHKFDMIKDKQQRRVITQVAKQLAKELTDLGAELDKAGNQNQVHPTTDWLIYQELEHALKAAIEVIDGHIARLQEQNDQLKREFDLQQGLAEALRSLEATDPGKQDTFAVPSSSDLGKLVSTRN